MTFCCREPRPRKLLTTRAPVRVICQPVAPMRAASTGNGTRSSLATSRCFVVVIVPVSQRARRRRKFVWTRVAAPVFAETVFQQAVTRHFSDGIPFRRSSQSHSRGRLPRLDPFGLFPALDAGN